MATIQTAIQLQDNFTGIFSQIIESVNLGLLAMQELQQNISEPVDTRSMEAARDSIHQAAAAVQELNESLQRSGRLNGPNPIVTENRPVRNPPSVPTSLPPIWNSYEGVEVFTNTGAERFQQELASVNNMLYQISTQQNQITRRANEMELLSPQASYDIQSVENRVQSLRNQIEQVEANSLTIGIEESNSALERLRFQMDQLVGEQEQLQLAMQGTDVGAINQAYLQLSQTLDGMERSVRDRFSQAINSSVTPVEVPVTWRTEELEVFTNTGIERFQQEVQSTNEMLQQLSGTQDAIARQAYQMDLLPPEAFQDLNQMAIRMDMIRNRIQQIENNPMNIGTDAANSELERFREQLNHAIQEQQNLNHAMQQMDVSAINESYLHLVQIIGSTERYIRDNVNAEGQFQSTIQETEQLAQRTSGEFRGWKKAIILVNQALNLIKNTLGQIGLFNLGGAFDRLDTMNRFQKTVTIMTGDANMASAALERLKNTTKGTAYGLDVAAKSTQNFLTRGMSLGTATDQVRVWADAVSFYGNGTNEQLENVIDAIGKIYSKGTVEQTQLDRLFDAGIGAAELYAEAVGRSVSEVKDDLTNRRISSADFIQTVTEALDAGVSAGAAKNAGDSWAATFANVRAAINRGWVDILTNLDAALASRGLPSAMQMISTFGQKVEDVLKTIGGAIGMVVDVVVNVYEILSGVGGFFIENWSMISPFIYGVAAALAVYAGYLAIVKTAEFLGVASKIAMCVASYAHAAATGTAASAIAAETAAQYGLNTAFLSCPLTWLILLIIALIAVIFAVCSAIAKMTGVAETGFGVLCGLVAMAATVILNIVIGLINAIIQAIWTIFVEPFLGIIEWILNVTNGGFDSFGAVVANLIGQIIGWFLSLGKVVTQIIDAIFGTNWTAGLSSLQNEVIGWGKNEKAITIEREARTISRIEYGDAFNLGSTWGDGIAEKLSSFQLSNEATDFPSPEDYTDLLNGMDSSLSEIANDTGNVSDSLSITEEDLKYMRDLAERETINRVTMTDIKIDMGGVTNHVNSEIDLDGMVNHLTEALETQIAISAEGIH